MKEAKDLFSKQAESYADFRPGYPGELFMFLYSQVRHYNIAWDCATGNGQTARQLAEKFKTVYATDISTALLKKAPEKSNINYRIERAEQTSFLADTFDLITVSTALHWFDFKAFFPEVKRVAKNKAIFAAWAYSPCRSITEVDALMDHYYSDIVGKYWDFERKYVEQEYKNIPFPFDEIHAPPFHIEVEWTMEQFKGFLRSWSSTQHYINENKSNPLLLIDDKLNKAWPATEKLKFIFPLFMRIGIVAK